MALGLLKWCREAVDMRGMAISVALYLAMFSMGLHLPFARPMRDEYPDVTAGEFLSLHDSKHFKRNFVVLGLTQ